MPPVARDRLPTSRARLYSDGELTLAGRAVLELAWVRIHLIEHPTENHWEALSREALRDDLDSQQRKLTDAILKSNNSLAAWAEAHEPLIARWHQVVAELRSSNVLNYTMFFVALRELLDLTETTIQGLGIAHA